MAKTTIDVLVFDSGVGGLSVLDSIRSHAPHLSYAFLGDNLGLPYGDKSETWLLDRVPKVIARLLETIECRVLVIACNTASTIVLPPLRALYPFPVIGVVPAIKPAAKLSQNKCIALLATPATVARPYTESLIQEFAEGCEVIRLGSSRLVAIAEEKMRGQAPDLAEIRTILSPILNKKPDVVVLGCTHFPLMREEFEAIDSSIAWIDSGEAIAKRVLHFGLQGQSSDSGVKSGTAYFTRNDIDVKDLKAFGLDRVLSLEAPL